MNERATAVQSHNPRDDAAKAVPLPYKRQEEKVASKDASKLRRVFMLWRIRCKNQALVSTAWSFRPHKKWKLIYYWERTKRKRWEKWEKPFLLWIIIFRRIILWLMTRLFQKIFIFSLRPIYHSCARNDNSLSFLHILRALLNVFSSFFLSAAASPRLIVSALGMEWIRFCDMLKVHKNVHFLQTNK